MIFRLKTIPLAIAALWRVITNWFTRKPIFVTNDEAAQRLIACENCVHYADSQCMLCTCFVTTKVLLRTEKCPVGRWPKL